jgi:hypothetical protein
MIRTFVTQRSFKIKPVSYDAQSDRASVGYSRNFARPLKQRPSLHELPIPEDTPLNP